ncbi:class I SAM-dependent methyltransferase [Gephyromycinifex aptenodytis]|uniref:class I SAM-dependent methyltransferase n=1 Tax=Gephyromycinifex aptenodytis TaxID=2716227 RepID=UPI001448233B|nr:class I SAM-dependent methyltransferase [Gephyromycinifex aptenodytis]
MSADRTRRAYSSLSDTYIGLFGHIESVLPADKAFIAEAFQGVHARILDAGCGPGHLTFYLQDLGYEASGIDLVPDFVAHAQQAYPMGDFSVGDITRIDERDRTLGGVLAWYSLIHMTEAELGAALAEFRRVLIPGGILVLGAFHAAQCTPFAHKVTPAIAFSEDEVKALLNRAGFEVVRWETRAATTETRAHLAVAAVAPVG